MTLEVFNAIAALLAELDKQKPPRITGENPEFISKREAAKVLGVSVRTIERYVSEGKLTKRMLCGKVRLLRLEVEGLVE